MSPFTKFLGVGAYVPPRVVTNKDLEALMDTSDEWIQQRTGIRQRHWVEGMTTTSDLALEAARAALSNAKMNPEELDMIVLCTLSPDHEFPGTGCFLQGKLGIPGIPALDVRQQCSGFLYGLSIADHYIRCGTYKKILLVGAEIHSKGLDKSADGREIGVLFGDGAGAVILGAGDETTGAAGSRLFSTHIHADGRHARELWIQAPSQAYEGERISTEILARKEHYAAMNGKMVYVNAVRKMPEAIQEALAANGKTLADVDLFLFHQANLRINEMVAKQLGISESKVFNTIDRFGNTTSATIPLGIHEALKCGRLQQGMLVATAAFGSGFTWGSALFRW